MFIKCSRKKNTNFLNILMFYSFFISYIFLLEIISSSIFPKFVFTTGRNYSNERHSCSTQDRDVQKNKTNITLNFFFFRNLFVLCSLLPTPSELISISTSLTATRLSHTIKYFTPPMCE